LLERLRGELLSVGFDVTVSDRPTELEAAATDVEVDAAVDLVGEPAPVAVEVWIVDGAHHFQQVARVDVDANTENAFKGVAIRASEVLRAHLFEKDVGVAKAPARAAPQTAKAPLTPSRTDRTRQFSPVGIELGAAVLASPDGIGPAFLPLLRLDWAVQPELVLQATGAGFGTRPSVWANGSHADIATQYGLVGACYRLDWKQRVTPLAAFSLGALRTAATGDAEPPQQGHSVDHWSVLFDASVGAAWQLPHEYTVVLEGHAQLAEPYVAIHFGKQKVASAGRPNLLLTLTLGAWP
jgi:hypothetical protein